MMIGVSKVSVINEPNISDIENLVVSLGEESFKVLRLFNQITEPNHGWKICLSSLQEFSSQLDFIVILSMESLYITFY